jgi:hypothetical protein
MKLAATAGAGGLAASAVAAAQPAEKKSKVNTERPVEGTATADRHGARELFAVVDWEGNLKRGLHAVSAKRLAVGHYEVIFDRDIRCGAYVATTGGHGYEGVPPAAIANVMGRANNPRAVLVLTSDMTGSARAAGFHLVVICPDGYA